MYRIYLIKFYKNFNLPQLSVLIFSVLILLYFLNSGKHSLALIQVLMDKVSVSKLVIIFIAMDFFIKSLLARIITGPLLNFHILLFNINKLSRFFVFINILEIRNFIFPIFTCFLLFAFYISIIPISTLIYLSFFIVICTIINRMIILQLFLIIKNRFGVLIISIGIFLISFNYYDRWAYSEFKLLMALVLFPISFFNIMNLFKRNKYYIIR